MPYLSSFYDCHYSLSCSASNCVESNDTLDGAFKEGRDMTLYDRMTEIIACRNCIK